MKKAKTTQTITTIDLSWDKPASQQTKEQLPPGLVCIQIHHVELNKDAPSGYIDFVCETIPQKPGQPITTFSFRRPLNRQQWIVEDALRLGVDVLNIEEKNGKLTGSVAIEQYSGKQFWATSKPYQSFNGIILKTGANKKALLPTPDDLKYYTPSDYAPVHDTVLDVSTS